MARELLPLLLPITLIVAGAVLTTLAAIRTRRPYPSCMRCAYDLSWIVGAVRTCPECGASLHGGRFRRANQRATRWECALTTGVVALSLGALVLPVVLGALLL